MCPLARDCGPDPFPTPAHALRTGRFHQAKSLWAYNFKFSGQQFLDPFIARVQSKLDAAEDVEGIRQKGSHPQLHPVCSAFA